MPLRVKGSLGMLLGVWGLNPQMLKRNHAYRDRQRRGVTGGMVNGEG